LTVLLVNFSPYYTCLFMVMHGWSSHWSKKYSCLPGVKEAMIKKICLTESLDIFLHWIRWKSPFSNFKESVRNLELQGKLVFTVYVYDFAFASFRTFRLKVMNMYSFPFHFSESLRVFIFYKCIGKLFSRATCRIEIYFITMYE
jgi:hypothetical protein